MGLCYSLQNRFIEAIQSHSKSLNLYRKIYGTNHMDVANAMFNVAVCMNYEGTYNDALKLLEKAREKINFILGDSCLDLVDILYQSAVSLRHLNDLLRSRANLEEAIQILQQHSQYENIKSSKILELIGDIVSTHHGYLVIVSFSILIYSFK